MRTKITLLHDVLHQNNCLPSAAFQSRRRQAAVRPHQGVATTANCSEIVPRFFINKSLLSRLLVTRQCCMRPIAIVSLYYATYRWINPLMGWTSTSNTAEQIRGTMVFHTKVCSAMAASRLNVWHVCVAGMADSAYIVTL